MAKLTRDVYLERLKTLIGEDASDDNIALLEDFTDTYDELSNSEQEDWKQRYEDNDAQWRKKYRDRFFNSEDNGDDFEKPNPAPEPNPALQITIDDLFTVKEN